MKSAFGLLKAFSNGAFSKVAKTWNPGEENRVLSLEAYKPTVVEGICNASK